MGIAEDTLTRITEMQRKQGVIDSLVGLPFVALTLTESPKVVGAMPDGSKIRQSDVELVFNNALLMDAIGGPGSYRATVATPGDLIALEVAERLYGVTVSVALPVWLKMDRTNYPTFADRPRRLYPRAVIQ